MSRLVAKVDNRTHGVIRYESPTWLVGVAALVAGVGVACYDRRPNPPEQYTVTSKAACLPKEGMPLRLGYQGRGTVDITILPPNPDATKAPEKEKK